MQDFRQGNHLSRSRSITYDSYHPLNMIASRYIHRFNWTGKGTGTFATGIAAVWASSCLEPAGGRWRRAADGSVLELEQGVRTHLCAGPSVRFGK